MPSFTLTNIRSISNKFDELVTFNKTHPCDIVVITETWLSTLTPSHLFCINDYTLYRCDRDSIGGGIGLWSRWDLEPIPITKPNIKTDILAMRSVLCKFLIVALYHPYWGNAKEHRILLSFLQDFIDGNKLPHEDIFIMGDVNDLRHHYNHFVAANNLFQVINKPTRGTNTLDIFLVSTTIASSYGNFDLHCPISRSDHCVINLNPVPEKNVKHKIQIRDYSPKNFALFGAFLNTLVWTDIFKEAQSVDELETTFSIIIYDLFDIFFLLNQVVTFHG